MTHEKMNLLPEQHRGIADPFPDVIWVPIPCCVAHHPDFL